MIAHRVFLLQIVLCLGCQCAGSVDQIWHLFAGNCKLDHLRHLRTRRCSLRHGRSHLRLPRWFRQQDRSLLEHSESHLPQHLHLPHLDPGNGQQPEFLPGRAHGRRQLGARQHSAWPCIPSHRWRGWAAHRSAYRYVSPVPLFVLGTTSCSNAGAKTEKR